MCTVLSATSAVGTAKEEGLDIQPAGVIFQVAEVQLNKLSVSCAGE